MDVPRTIKSSPVKKNDHLDSLRLAGNSCALAASLGTGSSHTPAVRHYAPGRTPIQPKGRVAVEVAITTVAKENVELRHTAETGGDGAAATRRQMKDPPQAA